MFNSAILDVAIGLVFTYLTLALICTTINEWIAGITRSRGKFLQEGVAGLLKEQPLTGPGASADEFLEKFRSHALIAGLRRTPDQPPSYLPPRVFALTVMDLVTKQKPGVISFEDLEAGINNLPPGCVKTSLLAAIQSTDRNVLLAQQSIEDWFNEAMDRVSGWYTRRKQVLSVIIAAVLTIFINADTLDIANKLWINPVLRQELVNQSQAEKPAAEGRPGDDAGNGVRLRQQLGDVVGWGAEWPHINESAASFLWALFLHLPGWIITMIAVSLGAPFWFDVLNRFMNIRAAGKSPAEKGKEPHKDPAS